MAEPLLEARGIVKSFGRVRALRGASFTVNAGEVVALIGDNGAGKSTLVKTLSGVHAPGRRRDPLRGPAGVDRQPGRRARARDRDRLPGPGAGAGPRVLGQPVPRPRGGRGRGLLGKLGFLDKGAMRRRTEEAFSQLGVGVQDATAAVATLSGGQRQGVAVARAVTWAGKVVFMDEPTAALGVVQTRAVLDLIRRVRDTGLAVVLISHNMPEVMEVSDRVEVLRLGERVARFTTADTSMEELVGAMTGALRHEEGGS